jgi:glycosyltransferase involved in cell wall biosynthesis
MTLAPDVSVVMSVYNGASSLHETMESILSQGGVSLEFIIINDGSTDGSDVILDNYASRDARVRILHQENQGLTCALIKGCEMAKGEYIARQDAGDIALPNRLRLQKEVLDQHEDCTFVSCWTSMIGPKDEYLFTNKGRGLATSPVRILSKEEGWGDGPTHHGSVMFCREAYVKAGGYRAAFYYAQDWDLWYRLAALGTFTMIDKCLLRARITPDSISSLHRDRQVKYARLLRNSRVSGHSDARILREAERLRFRKSRAIRRSDQGRGMYFIGKCLLNNNDPRGTGYLLSAISANPFLLRAWWWAAISLARHPSGRILPSRVR